MRIFLAIEVPENIRKKLVGVQEELKPKIAGVRWEKAEKLHITLVFLGRVEDERVGELEEVVRKELSPAPRGVQGKGLKVGFSGVDVFPDEKKPRVVLMDVARGAEQIMELQKRLATVLADAGFEFAQLKKPHVTLGRFPRHIQAPPGSKVQTDASGLEQILKVQQRTNVAGFGVKEVVIVESKLHPNGAIHTPLVRILLRDPPGAGGAGRAGGVVQ